MNQEEIKTLREKFAARDCENQVEFETWMEHINAEQSAIVAPYERHLAEVTQRTLELDNKRLDICKEINQLKVRRLLLEGGRKEVNALFHELKHAMIERNPREKFIRPKEEDVPEEYDDPDDIDIVAIEEKEKKGIKRALELHDYNLHRTAEALGVSVRTLCRRIAEYGIDVEP